MKPSTLKRLASLLPVLAAAPLAAAEPVDSLVSYWTLDGHVYDTAAAGSVTDNGSWVGSADYGPGMFGDGIVLSGANHISVPASVDVDGSGADISICAWFRVTAWDKNWQCLIAKGEGDRWRVARRGSDANEMSFAGGTGDIFGGAVNDGGWHHIVAVSEAGVSTRLWVDGILRSTGGGPGLGASGQPVMIGENPDATGRQWVGPIDDVGIFSIPLNDLQAAAIYDLAVHPEYGYDLGEANQILAGHAGGPGTIISIGDTNWEYAASDPGGGNFFLELGVDGSGMTGITGPGIISFTADHLVIAPGEELELSWEVGTSATTLNIDQGIGNVLPLTTAGVGQITLGIGPSVNTTYTLTAGDAEGVNTRQLAITVTDQPIVDHFTADKTVVEAGTAVSLSWNARNVASLDLNGTPVTGTSGLVVYPAATMTYTLTATNAQGVVVVEIDITIVVPGEPVINEFVADNFESLLDEDGNSSDWIELANPSGTPAILDDYYLTDDPNLLTKWRIPHQILNPGEFLLVFASGKDRAVAGSELHANFSLRASGEYLALVKVEFGTPVILQEFNDFPKQFEDMSYGVGADAATTGYMPAPSPGTANGSVLLDYVRDTTFFPDRGFYETAQSVEITSTTPGATIRYTLDGSAPSETHGSIYSGPISIITTTTLRAIAYKQDHISTNVDAQTYIFLDQVLQQPTNPPGFPSSWLSQAADYGMDPDVVNDPAYSATIKDDLKSIPTISIAMETDDLFGSAGIYSNPRNSGAAWERPGSMEIIYPDGSIGHQVTCAVRMQGGVGRYEQFLKHNFRLLFKRGFGPTKLDYPLFETATEDAEGATEKFDTIILRGGFNNTWHRNNVGEETRAQYLRDQWMHDSQLAMGHASCHGTFFHLYLNGLYWGVYNVVERPSADFASSYYGGKKEEWDALNSYPRNVVDGTATAWTTAHGIAAQAVMTNQIGYNSLAQYVDIPNLIDYMLLNFYAGNIDWDDHNWYAARHRVPGAGYKFFSWDAERTLEGTTANDRTGIGQDNKPSRLYERLKQNPEFLLEFADHAHKHLFNNGTLTPLQNAARYQELATFIDRAIVGESARWGDSQRATPYTRDGVWVTERDRLLNDYFPQRTDVVLGFLRGHSPALYPSIDAPVFSQHGGHIANTTPLTMSAAAGTIYYTLDGSDPRLSGGSINPAALTYDGGTPPAVTLVDSGSTWKYHDQGADLGGAWRDHTFNDSSWASGPAELGYDNNPVTTVSFGPDSNDKYITTYYRHQFTATGTSNYTGLTLEVMRDDGVLVYLNGNLILSNNMPGGTIDYLTTASSVVGGSDESTFFSFAVPMDDLNEGLNTLAVEIHQISNTSSDTSFDLRLKATQAAGGGGELYLADTGTMKARAFNGSEWSALNEALFIVDAELASDQNLVLSEINYNPLPPTPQEEELGLNERSDFEFIQLTNIGATDVDLTNVRFTDGITFNFNESLTGFILPAGASVVIVNNMTGFTARYPSVPASVIAGKFDGNLSDGGEHIELLTTDDSMLRALTYDDKPLWPEAPDGDGLSLVLIDPMSNPDHTDPLNWRSSVSPGGTPNGSDASQFAGNANDDGDHDGVSALMEYAFGSSDSVSNDTLMPTGAAESLDAGSGPEDHFTISYRRNLAADDVEIEVQITPNLEDWYSGPGEVEFVRAVHNGDGTETVTCRSALPMADSDREFMRVKVSLR